MDTKQRDLDAPDRKEDPITGAPGAHPVGVGVGAALGGAATGAAVGAVAGPIGAAVGAAAGAVVGGLAGKAVAEKIDPTAEEAYWRKTHASRPYYDKAMTYDDYSPAYRYGWESRSAHAGRTTFDEVDGDLGRGWDKAKAKSRLGWDKAKHATRDAWERVTSTDMGPRCQ